MCSTSLEIVFVPNKGRNPTVYSSEQPKYRRGIPGFVLDTTGETRQFRLASSFHDAADQSKCKKTNE
jgi:hypothetical protein